MRITYVNQTYPPMITGVSHMLSHLAQGMVERGHTVQVIVASDVGKPYTITSPGLKLVRLRSIPNPMAANQRLIAFSKREIEKSLQQFAPDILHFHDPMLACLVHSGRAGRRRYPRILTAHINPRVTGYYALPSPMFSGWVRDGTAATAKWIFRHCDAVVTPTHTIADYVTQYNDQPVRVISNGIDLQQFSPEESSPGEGARLRQKLGLHPERPIILSVGRLSKEKNVDAVICAAALALHEMDAQLVIAGDGPDAERAARKCESEGISDRCVFPGFVYPDDDLPALYRQASVFVSASEVEAQGLVLLEAAASGLPIVTVRAGAAPEIVRDGVNGWLAEPGDLSGLVAGMIAAIRNPEAARRMGRAGRRISEAHALQRTYHEHERFYRSLLSGSPGLLRKNGFNRKPKWIMHGWWGEV